MRCTHKSLLYQYINFHTKALFFGYQKLFTRTIGGKYFLKCCWRCIYNISGNRVLLESEKNCNGFLGLFLSHQKFFQHRIQDSRELYNFSKFVNIIARTKKIFESIRITKKNQNTGKQQTFEKWHLPMKIVYLKVTNGDQSLSIDTNVSVKIISLLSPVPVISDQPEKYTSKMSISFIQDHTTRLSIFFFSGR